MTFGYSVLYVFFFEGRASDMAVSILRRLCGIECLLRRLGQISRCFQAGSIIRGAFLRGCAFADIRDRWPVGLVLRQLALVGSWVPGSAVWWGGAKKGKEECR